jgi:hypothetical protein
MLRLLDTLNRNPKKRELQKKIYHVNLLMARKDRIFQMNIYQLLKKLSMKSLKKDLKLDIQ